MGNIHNPPTPIWQEEGVTVAVQRIGNFVGPSVTVANDASNGRANVTVEPVMPSGAGGTTVDAAGEVTVDTTSRTLNFHDGTAEVVLNPVEKKAFVIPDPVATDDYPIMKMDVAGTLISIDYLCIGGTNVICQMQEMDANGGSGVDVHAADVTAVAGTNNNQTSFSNAAFDAGDYLGIKVTSISGTPTSLTVTFRYREDP